MFEVNGNKVFITHGIYGPLRNLRVTVRNTDKYLPIPIKFRRTLRKYFLRWFHIKKTVYWKRTSIKIDKIDRINKYFILAPG